MRDPKAAFIATIISLNEYIYKTECIFSQEDRTLIAKTFELLEEHLEEVNTILKKDDEFAGSEYDLYSLESAAMVYYLLLINNLEDLFKGYEWLYDIVAILNPYEHVAPYVKYKNEEIHNANTVD